MQLLSPSIYPPKPWDYRHKVQTTTPGTTSLTLCEQWVGSLTSHRVIYEQGLWDGTSGLSSLSEKTRKSNHLQMSLQRQHFLLGYLKTLSVGPAGVWTHDLPHGSPVLHQLSQPVGHALIQPYHPSSISHGYNRFDLIRPHQHGKAIGHLNDPKAMVELTLNCLWCDHCFQMV